MAAERWTGTPASLSGFHGTAKINPESLLMEQQGRIMEGLTNTSYMPAKTESRRLQRVPPSKNAAARHKVFLTGEASHDVELTGEVLLHEDQALRLQKTLPPKVSKTPRLMGRLMRSLFAAAS